jgi:hypothetical protein
VAIQSESERLERINTGTEQSKPEPEPESGPKHKQDHISWRRNMVLEYISQGRTEREVAQILKVGNGTVHRDIDFLNKQARDNLKFHIQDRLPAQYIKCQSGLDQVLKMAWNLITTDTVNQSNKLQALSLISDCYRYQMDLSTNAGIVEEAMRFHSSNTELLIQGRHSTNTSKDKKMIMVRLRLKHQT